MFYYACKHLGFDEVHEQECLEYGVGELRCLLEKLGCFRWVLHHEPFHLREDIEKLCSRKGVEGLRYGIGTGDVGSNVNTWW